MSTKNLLNAICKDFPRRKRELERLLKLAGIDEDPIYLVNGPECVHRIPTFDSSVIRSLSPMLTVRFATYGEITMGPDRWLAISEIRATMLAEEICSYHKALRENVADSFPAIYSDDHLSLFGYSPGVFDAAIYLAWNSENGEPLVAAYSGYECHAFPDLDRYLEWVLERD
jgi:hypothetical protein